MLQVRDRTEISRDVLGPEPQLRVGLSRADQATLGLRAPILLGTAGLGEACVLLEALVRVALLHGVASRTEEVRIAHAPQQLRQAAPKESRPLRVLGHRVADGVDHEASQAVVPAHPVGDVGAVLGDREEHDTLDHLQEPRVLHGVWIALAEAVECHTLLRVLGELPEEAADVEPTRGVSHECELVSGLELHPGDAPGQVVTQARRACGDGGGRQVVEVVQDGLGCTGTARVPVQEQRRQARVVADLPKRVEPAEARDQDDMGALAGELSRAHR